MHQCSPLLSHVTCSHWRSLLSFSSCLSPSLYFSQFYHFFFLSLFPNPSSLSRSKTCFYPIFLWTTAASKYILQNKRVLNNRPHVSVYVTWNNRCVCVLWEWPHCDVMWSDAMWVELVCGFWNMIGSLCGRAMPPCIKRKPLTHTHAYFFIADCINRSPWLLSFLWVSTCVCVCPCRCLNH